MSRSKDIATQSINKANKTFFLIRLYLDASSLPPVNITGQILQTEAKDLYQNLNFRCNNILDFGLSYIK